MSKKKDSEKFLKKLKKGHRYSSRDTNDFKGFNFPKLNCIVVVDADFSGRGYDLEQLKKIFNYIIN